MLSFKRAIVLYSRWEILVEPLKSLPRQGHTLLYHDEGAYKTLLQNCTVKFIQHTHSRVQRTAPFIYF